MEDRFAAIMEANTKTLTALTEVIAKLADDRNQPPAAPTPPSKEQTLDTLGRNITDFEYDPDNGLTFESWYNRHLDCFDEKTTGLSKEDLVRLLMRKLSTSVYTSYDNHIAPKRPTEINFDDHVEKLKTLFGRKKSIFSLRFECLNIIKRRDDEYTSYAGLVNRLCENFDFEKLKKDQFKCLVFILGLKDSKEAEIRMRLLALMDRHVAEEKDISMTDLLKEISRVQCLVSDTRLVGGQQSDMSSSIQKVDNKTLSAKSDFTPKLSRPCKHCGGEHYDRQCPNQGAAWPSG